MEDSTRISAPSRWRRQVIDELSRSQTHTERAEIQRVPSGRRQSGQWKLHPFNLTSAGAPGSTPAGAYLHVLPVTVTSVLKLWVCVWTMCVFYAAVVPSGSPLKPPLSGDPGTHQRNVVSLCSPNRISHASVFSRFKNLDGDQKYGWS